MTVVNGKGEKKVLKEVSAHEKGNDLLAGQTSLGVLGVALEYTVKVQEMSYCRVQNDFDMRLGVCSMVSLASTPGPLTFVFSWRAWFAMTTWGRIEVKPGHAWAVHKVTTTTTGNFCCEVKCS